MPIPLREVDRGTKRRRVRAERALERRVDGDLRVPVGGARGRAQDGGGRE